MKILKNRKGFTLIELLVVIAIIGILSAGATAVYTSQIAKARDSTRISDIDSTKVAIEMVYQSYGMYPAKKRGEPNPGVTEFSEVGFNTIGANMETLPKDPKSGQTCAGPTACDYVYDVKNSASGVENQRYNLSTGFEDDGNKNTLASGDEGVMDDRYETGSGKNKDTSGGEQFGEMSLQKLDKGTTGSTNSCREVVAATGAAGDGAGYYLISGPCSN